MAEVVAIEQSDGKKLTVLRFTPENREGPGARLDGQKFSHYESNLAQIGAGPIGTRYPTTASLLVEGSCAPFYFDLHPAASGR